MKGNIEFKRAEARAKVPACFRSGFNQEGAVLLSHFRKFFKRNSFQVFRRIDFIDPLRHERLEASSLKENRPPREVSPLFSRADEWRVSRTRSNDGLARALRPRSSGANSRHRRQDHQ